MSFVWDKIQIVDGEPSVTILIIARTRRYVEEWCRIHEVNSLSPRVRMVSSVQDLYRITGSYYVDLGTGSEEVRTLLERLKAMDVIRPLLTPNI